MKIKSLVAGIAAVLSLAGVANAATTTVNGGPIHFKGKLLMRLVPWMPVLLARLCN